MNPDAFEPLFRSSVGHELPESLGRYRIGDPLGRGATAWVVHAHDLERGHDVALKVLRSERVTAEDRRRFSAEAQKLARIRHPNVVRVLDSGEAGGETYIAMEFVDGSPLSDAWRDPPDAREILELALGLARGMEAIHAAGLIHRDLKPENVLVRRDGRPVIIDFGIGKDIDADTDITGTRTFPGTLRYMAPEVLNRNRPSEASDLYAFGAILHELRTGERFERDRIARIDEIAAREGHGVGRDLDRIIRQCLKEDREQRLSYRRSLVAELEQALAPRSRFARYVPLSALPLMALLALALYVPWEPESSSERNLAAGHAFQLAVVGYLAWHARQLWRRDGRTLELASFWLFPWLTFVPLYAWKLLHAWRGSGAHVDWFLDAVLSNLNACAFLVCYLALVMPTRKLDTRRPPVFVRWCRGLGLLWLALALAASSVFWSASEEAAHLAASVPAAILMGLSLGLLAAGLHDRELRPAVWLRAVFLGYALAQIAYIVFEDLPPLVLTCIYSFALVAKLLLHGHVTELVCSGRLHTYEGRASGRR